MACLLVATEADEGLGHVLPWQAFARQAAQVGHRVHVAAPNVGLLHACLGASAIGVWQSPRLRPSASVGGKSPKSWPELLVSLGYADAQQMAGAVRAWCCVLEHVRPAVVLADYAPALMVACHALRIPVLEVGVGYCVPEVVPQVALFPGVGSVDRTPLEDACRAVVQAVNGCLAELRVGVPMRAFADLHTLAAERIVLSPARFDHYGERATVRYAGLRARPDTQERAHAGGLGVEGGVQLVGYLKNPGDELVEIARQLNRVGVAGRIFAPHFPQDGPKVLGGIAFTREMLDLDALLPHAAFYLSNGGFSGVTDALAMGCWPVAVPQQVEQVAMGRLLVNAGSGSLWLPQFTQATEKADVVRGIFAPRPRTVRVDAGERTAEAYLLEVVQRLAEG